SSTTRVPGVRRPAIARVADSTAPTLGRLSSSSGVGTQMTIVSASARIASSEVARKPRCRISAMSASDRSSMWERDSVSPSTTARDTSNPTTSRPAWTAACTSGMPTYPRPMTTASTAKAAPPGLVGRPPRGVREGLSPGNVTERRLPIMASPLRILVVTVVHDPEDARIRHRQLPALVEAGHEVAYAAPFTAFDRTPPEGVWGIDLPRARGRNRLKAVGAARTLLSGMARSADVILLHDPDLLLSATLLPRREATIIWDVHE